MPRPIAPAIYSGRMVVAFLDYNNTYWQIIYADWTYQGNPMDSKLWQLWPKSVEYTASQIHLSTNGAHKGEYYLQGHSKDVRHYIPNNFYQTLNLEPQLV